MRWRVNGNPTDMDPSPDSVSVSPVEGRLMVRSPEGVHSAVAVRVSGKTLVSFRGRVFEIEKGSAGSKVSGVAASGDFTAPMPGLIVDIQVAEGDSVVKGQKLLVLEAMKTQQPVIAPFDGIVVKVGVSKGQQVVDGELMVSMRENAPPPS